MNPFQVLGVAPTATRDEVEAAYRRELRVHHPDLHHGGSPDEVAEAERATRRLNEAMALVRGGWRPLPGDGPGFRYEDQAWGPPPTDDGPGSRWDESFRYDDQTDWFGNPVKGRRAPPVECPLCGLWFQDPVLYRSHLDHDHDLGDVDQPKESAPRRDPMRWLDLLPVPTLSLAVMLCAYWALVVAVLPKPLAIAGIWLGVVAFTLGLRRALRRRPRW